MWRNCRVLPLEFYCTRTYLSVYLSLSVALLLSRRLCVLLSDNEVDLILANQYWLYWLIIHRHRSQHCDVAVQRQCPIHTADADATQLLSRVASALCTEFATCSSRRIWSNNWTLNMLRIYPVQLAAELETGSRLPMGEYTPYDTTQLDSTCSVFNFSTKFVSQSSWTTHSCNSTVESRLQCVLGLTLRWTAKDPLIFYSEERKQERFSNRSVNICCLGGGSLTLLLAW